MISEYLKYHLNPSKDYHRLEHLVSEIEDRPLHTFNNILQRMVWVGVRDGSYGWAIGETYMLIKDSPIETIPQVAMLTGVTYGLSRMLYHHIKIMRNRK